ncbi:unnamed protein product [Brachionus calyciflorus]|uniref:EGF-like domain-containing protein n=1 Tax=Brachionus calyciflorus TaxID=104777 RepID=A0A814PHU2_9BILA|nr:unnamed protein product [Brachionus calyciflorus]
MTIKVIEYIFFLSLLRLIQVFRCQSLYVTGSDDNSLKIWNDSSVILSKNISRKVTCLNIDYNRNIIIAGTDNGKVVGWDVQSNSLIFDNGNETNKVNSILIINSTHLLAGYNRFIIFWSLPELCLIKKINDARFGTIGEMKNLAADNLVLIFNVETKMIVFSLKNNSILRENVIYEQGYSFDLIDRNFIFSPCRIEIANDICLFKLNSDFSLFQTDLKNFVDINFPSLKILNRTFGIYSTDGSLKNLGFMNFHTKNSIEIYTVSSIIRSIDVLNDRIVVCHQNGSISHYNKINFKFIKTFREHNLNSPKNVIKKYIDFMAFQNLLSTTTTSTTLFNTEIRCYHSSIINPTSDLSTNKNLATQTTHLPSTYVSTLRNDATFSEKINMSRTSLNKFQSTLNDETTILSLISNKESTLKPTFFPTTEATSSFWQYINFFKMSPNEIIKFLRSDIDLNSCILNCSENGYCKMHYQKIMLVEKIKLICECFDNFSGEKCELNTLPCFKNKCKNNASCINNLKDKTYSCECSAGNKNKTIYYGDYCEYKMDLCANETCSKNGFCIDTGNEIKCICFSKFSGEKCEIESTEIKVIKMVIKTSSLLAIIFLAMTYCFMIISDFSKLFIKEKRNKQKNKYRPKIQRIQKYQYIN